MQETNLIAFLLKLDVLVMNETTLTQLQGELFCRGLNWLTWG